MMIHKGPNEYYKLSNYNSVTNYQHANIILIPTLTFSHSFRWL